MRILKFGGTSVGNYDRINSVIEIVKSYLKRKERLAVVCSAFGGITDLLAVSAKKEAVNDNSYLDTFSGFQRCENGQVNQPRRQPGIPR